MFFIIYIKDFGILTNTEPKILKFDIAKFVIKILKVKKPVLISDKIIL